MDAHPLAPWMFAGLVACLLSGFPVAFALAAVATVFGMLGLIAGAFHPEFLLAMPQRAIGIFFNDNLLAVPFFTFMGMVLERTGLAEQMLDALGRLFGRVRGGLAYAVIAVGAILAATTGTVSASVIAMGLISLPIMLRYGYDSRVATGVIAASGTLAQIIPPGLVLIVLAEQLEVPLGDIYRAVLLPASMLVAAYMLYVLGISLIAPKRVPPAPAAAIDEPLRALLARAAASALPPLLLIAAILASIYFGVATPSEGGAIGAAGALLIATAKRRLSLRNLKQAMDTTGIICSCILFLVIGSSFFTLIFRGFDGHLWIESLFAHLPGGTVGFLVVINVLVFVLAFFLDFFEIAFIVLPLIVPIAEKMGIDMVWLAVLVATNLQTSFMHPPFGIALFNLRSVAPAQVRTRDIYWGAVPFLLIQLAMVALLVAFPGLVTAERAVEDAATSDLELKIPTLFELEQAEGPPEPAKEASR